MASLLNMKIIMIVMVAISYIAVCIFHSYSTMEEVKDQEQSNKK